MSAPDSKPVQNPLVKLALEMGPLIIFFVVNGKFGIFAGTGAFMVAISASLLVSWITTRTLPTVALVTAAIVLVFGGLTLYLHDEMFIKLKPTIINGLFAAVLLGGLTQGKFFIKPVMAAAIDMTDEGWRILSLRWGLFFLVMAIVNEIVWRNFSTDFWVSFKLFGFLPLSFIFAVAQVPAMNRHSIVAEEEAS